MSNKAQGATLLVVGIVIMILALSADSIGVGSNPGLGLLQLIGILIGAVVAAVGVVRMRSRSSAAGPAEDPRDEPQ